MIYLAVIAVLSLAALAYEKHQNAEREKEWALERGALLQRIQHPEIIVGQAQEQVIPDEVLRDIEADESDLVGEIVIGSENGNGDN